MTPAQRQQLVELRRRGFGMPAARELADQLERIDRWRVTENVRRRFTENVRRSTSLPAVQAKPTDDRVTWGDVGACVLIVLAMLAVVLL